jgi:hypothetical protein
VTGINLTVRGPAYQARSPANDGNSQARSGGGGNRSFVFDSAKLDCLLEDSTQHCTHHTHLEQRLMTEIDRTLPAAGDHIR